MSAGNENGVASKDFLNRIAEGSGHVDESGNFSIEVLKSALLSQFNLTLVNTLMENIRNKEITNFDGFICNKLSHWFAIRKINGRFWNLNSTNERPESISHFRLAAEIQAYRDEGYSVFCVAEIGALPAECKNEAEIRNRGAKEFWWKESDLISGRGTRGYSNPWGNAGNGMRLDGKSTAGPAGNDMDGNAFNIEGLTEEEQLQMALAASIQPEKEFSASAAPAMNLSGIHLTPEPDKGTAGAVRIQLRLPDGKKVTRRFLESDLVKVIYAFVHGQCPSGDVNKKLELRAGFPPKDIFSFFEDTIRSANLSGESIQCSYS